MKKSNFIVGMFYIIAGLICLLTAIYTESRLGSLLFGFAGAGLGPGILMICQYFYWSSPKHKERYQERLENERIEQHDELKVQLRDKSGRYTYILGLLTISISMVVFSILGSLEIMDARIILIYLGGYLLFQILAGIAIFNRLLKKY